MRSCPDRVDPAQLAVPARPPHRCLRPDPAALSRSMTVPTAPLRMPAEWEPHRATWISWPHHEPDWPGKLAAIPWVYAEIARAIAAHEAVEILCHSEEVRQQADE